jgi:predicted RND superfamily exporter protein
LALGIERIGFFALSHRTLCAIVFVILSAIAAVGFVRVKVDDSLSQLFRSDTDEFRTYEEVTRRFPSNEFDVLIVIEGDRLLERSSLEKLRELAIEVQLIDGTRGLISIFSAREPPEQGSIPPPLFPNPLPEGADYQALIKRVTSNEIIKGKMLSDDGKLTLMVLALEPTSTAPDKLGPTIGAIREAVKTNLEGTGLKAELSGVPVMQLEIRNAIQSDRLVYNTLGFAVGCLIAIIFFRRPVVHDHCGGATASGHFDGARRAWLAGVQPEHVPERDDPADHGHQFLRQHAAHLRRPRPAARRG